jgi:hypothetical protein
MAPFEPRFPTAANAATLLAAAGGTTPLPEAIERVFRATICP